MQLASNMSGANIYKQMPKNEAPGVACWVARESILRSGWQHQLAVLLLVVISAPFGLLAAL